METVASNAAYTPCKICNQPGQPTPVWEVGCGAHVVYDEVRHRIYYKDAVVELTAFRWSIRPSSPTPIPR